ncbi:hypothetical protein U1Q18_047831 [Sarracenia purpurea var. burkii]
MNKNVQDDLCLSEDSDCELVPTPPPPSSSSMPAKPTPIKKPGPQMRKVSIDYTRLIAMRAARKQAHADSKTSDPCQRRTTKPRKIKTPAAKEPRVELPMIIPRPAPIQSVREKVREMKRASETPLRLGPPQRNLFSLRY